jgi:hypothetical protein
MILSWAFPCETLLDGGGPEQALKARVEGVAVSRKSRKKTWKMKTQQIKKSMTRVAMIWFGLMYSTLVCSLMCYLGAHQFGTTICEINLGGWHKGSRSTW